MTADELVELNFKTEPPDGRQRTTPPANPTAEAEDTGTDPDRRSVLIVGASLTATTLVLATTFTFRARSADKDAEQARNSIGGDDSECLQSSASACSDLGDSVQQRENSAVVATGSWIAMGVFGGATIATWLLWPAQPGGSATQILPAASRRYGGVLVQGAF